jgi:hypothetical protein
VINERTLSGIRSSLGSMCRGEGRAAGLAPEVRTFARSRSHAGGGAMAVRQGLDDDSQT